MKIEPHRASRNLREIILFIGIQGGTYPRWYVGLTSDWENSLFTEHNVPQEDYRYIIRQCHSNVAARSVKEALLQLGCDCEIDGDDEKAVYVYAYIKRPMTNP